MGLLETKKQKAFVGFLMLYGVGNGLTNPYPLTSAFGGAVGGFVFGVLLIALYLKFKGKPEGTESVESADPN